MFGKKKEGEKKQGCFFKAKNLDDAFEAMRLAYQVFYALAAIHVFVLFVFFAPPDASDLVSLLDTAVMVLLARLIQLRESRTAAIFLLIESVYFIDTRLNMHFEAWTGGTWAGYIFFVAFAIFSACMIYGACMGIQGTFKFHALSASKVVWKNVFIQTGVISTYALLSFVATAILFSGGEGMSDETYGFIFFAPIFAAIFAGAFRVLPGTRKRVLVIRDQPTMSNIDENVRPQ